MIRVNKNITLQDWEVSESFLRASGPGGQHVNKVSTAVELRFEAARSPQLTPGVKARLQRLAGRKWTKDGAVIVTAEKYRSQAMNRELAERKLVELISAALVQPKKRIPTRPSLASKNRRVEGKVKRGFVKQLRGKVGEE